MKKAMMAMGVMAGLLMADVASAGDYSGDTTWYVMVGAGQATSGGLQSGLDHAINSAGFSGFSSSLSKPLAYKLHLGYRVNDNFAIEGGYIGSNSQTYTASGGNLPGSGSLSTSLQGFDIVGVGIIPINDDFSLLGKLGIANMKQSVGQNNFLSGSNSKSGFTFGVGAKYDINKTVFVRFDLDSYTTSNRISVWNADVGYKF